jgi:hypothetical protein
VVTPDRLRSIAFWSRDLNDKEFEQARRGIVERTFPQGAYICHRGDRLDAWTGVASGFIKLSTVSRTGKAVTLAGVRAGGWFGEGTILKDEPRQYDLVALRDTGMALMNRSTFLWLFENSVAFNVSWCGSSTSAWDNSSRWSSTTACWTRPVGWRGASPGCSIPCSIATSACTSRFRRRSLASCPGCPVRSPTRASSFSRARACCGSSTAGSRARSRALVPLWGVGFGPHGRISGGGRAEIARGSTLPAGKEAEVRRTYPTNPLRVCQVATCRKIVSLQSVMETYQDWPGNSRGTAVQNEQARPTRGRNREVASWRQAPRLARIPFPSS